MQTNGQKLHCYVKRVILAALSSFVVLQRMSCWQ